MEENETMNLLKKLLWIVRIERGMREVERLAAQHQGDPLYRITTAQDALSIFEESSAQAARLARTTAEEGEAIEELFLKRWKAKYPWCGDGTIPALD
jgi:hypothetical protein